MQHCQYVIFKLWFNLLKFFILGLIYDLFSPMLYSKPKLIIYTKYKQINDDDPESIFKLYQTQHFWSNKCYTLYTFLSLFILGKLSKYWLYFVWGNWCIKRYLLFFLFKRFVELFSKIDGYLWCVTTGWIYKSQIYKTYCLNKQTYI